MTHSDFIEAVDAWMNVLMRDKQVLVERLSLSPDFVGHFVHFTGCDMHWIHLLMDKSPGTFIALKKCFRQYDSLEVAEWMERFLASLIPYSTMRRNGYNTTMTRTLARLLLLVALLEKKIVVSESAETFLTTCDAFLSDEALQAFYCKHLNQPDVKMECFQLCGIPRLY